MGKASRKKLEKEQQRDAIQMQEGLIRVSFVFDGKEYVKLHQLTGHELRSMKGNIQDFGDGAAGSALWLSCVWGAGKLGENILAAAARGYMKDNRIPESGFKHVEIIEMDQALTELKDEY